MKVGEYKKAVQDADACIRMKANYHKGYSRKGAGHLALQQYDEAIQAYTLGLERCGKVAALESGLAAAHRAKLDATPQSQALQTSQAAFRASQNQHASAQRSPTISGFIATTRRELKLQIAALEAQLDFIDSLLHMTDEAKMKLLFNVVDNDRDGKVCAKELAFALRRRNAEWSLDAALDKAIVSVAIFDTDGDARLNMQEFEEYVRVLLTELNISFDEFAEFMVLQLLFSKPSEQLVKEENQLDREDIDRQVKTHAEMLTLLGDERLFELFNLFDKNSKGQLTFKDVAVGLYPLTQDMEQSAKTTMELLLMIDNDEVDASSRTSEESKTHDPPNSPRTINYEQFGRLMMGIVATRNSSFDQVADELVLALTSKEKDKKNSKETSVANLMIADEMYQSFKKTVAEGRDVVTHSRLQKLFDLWDTNDDGKIGYDELKQGFASFEKSVGRKSGLSPEMEAQVFLNFATHGSPARGGSPKSGAASLNKREFARAISQYAKLFQVNLHELIDFMCLTAVLPEDRADMYSQAYRSSFTGRRNASIRGSRKLMGLHLNDSVSEVESTASLSSSSSTNMDNASPVLSNGVPQSPKNPAKDKVSSGTPNRRSRSKLSKKLGSAPPMSDDENDENSIQDFRIPPSPASKKSSKTKKSSNSTTETPTSKVKKKKKKISRSSYDTDDDDDSIQDFRMQMK